MRGLLFIRLKKTGNVSAGNVKNKNGIFYSTSSAFNLL